MFKEEYRIKGQPSYKGKFIVEKKVFWGWWSPINRSYWPDKVVGLIDGPVTEPYIFKTTLAAQAFIEQINTDIRFVEDNKTKGA